MTDEKHVLNTDTCKCGKETRLEEIRAGSGMYSWTHLCRNTPEETEAFMRPIMDAVKRMSGEDNG